MVEYPTHFQEFTFRLSKSVLFPIPSTEKTKTFQIIPFCEAPKMSTRTYGDKPIQFQLEENGEYYCVGSEVRKT